MPNCRVCDRGHLLAVINLGDQPIAHRLLSEPDDEEDRYPLALHYCPGCQLIQICHPIDPAILYLDYNYCFSSWKPNPHMDDEIETILSHTQKRSVLEIGCNDGSFLEAFQPFGVETRVGIEPNPFACERAKEKGLHVYQDMLNPAVCHTAVERFGRFETVIARQVLEHLPDIKGFFECLDILIEKDGFLFIDIPDVWDSLAMGDCSLIWEEHVNYFVEPAVRKLLQRFGYRPLSVVKYNFSGGTQAILACRGNGTSDPAAGADLDQATRRFKQKVETYGQRLRETLIRFHKNGARVVLYGVGCRACTLVNGLKMAAHIDFAIDDQMERQGKYMPGSRLPIRAPQVLQESTQPILCLLAVNQENESKVKRTAQEAAAGKIQFASLQSPNDIWLELDKLDE